MTRHLTSSPIKLMAASLLVFGYWTPVAMIALGVQSASAAPPPGRAGGGQRVRTSSRTNINGAANRNVNRNVNRNANVNRNVNINRNVNVNTRGGYYGGGGCYGCDWDDHDFARGMVAGAVTGAVVGAAVASSNRTTVVTTSPGTIVEVLPSGCSAVSVGGITYSRCGSIWYQPRYVGTSVQYVVVTEP